MYNDIHWSSWYEDKVCMRAGLAKELAGIAADDEASAQSECRPMDLLQVIDMPEAYFEDLPDGWMR